MCNLYASSRLILAMRKRRSTVLAPIVERAASSKGPFTDNYGVDGDNQLLDGANDGVLVWSRCGWLSILISLSK